MKQVELVGDTGKECSYQSAFNGEPQGAVNLCALWDLQASPGPGGQRKDPQIWGQLLIIHPQVYPWKPYKFFFLLTGLCMLSFGHLS